VGNFVGMLATFADAAKHRGSRTVKHRAVKRRTVVMGIGATAGVAAAGGLALDAQASSNSSTSASSASSASSSDSLVFDPDGKTVDPTNAPILFANSIGGYMPSSVADAAGVGAGGMGGGGGMPSGAPTEGAAPSGSTSNANGNTNATGGATASNQLLALAAG